MNEENEAKYTGSGLGGEDSSSVGALEMRLDDLLTG
jgi:hypothetical protein